MNVKKIREDFPLLNSVKAPIYFDNACMSLKPRIVIDKLNEYYNEYPACVGRSNHHLGIRAEEEYNKARSILKKFVNAKKENEIIFLRNTTEAINLVSKSFEYDIIISTDKEHNSNLVPWIEQKKKGKKHIIIKTPINLEEFKKIMLDHRGKKVLVSIVHTSNMDGTTNPIKEIIKISHDAKAVVMLDGAQAVPHTPIDVKKLDVDFLAFSGHKMLGPTGTGILYGKTEMLEKLKPYNVGGDTVKDTTYDSIEYEELPHRFEAGLQDYAGMIALGEAANYLSRYNREIDEHLYKLNKTATESLSEYINILGPIDPKQRAGILSFNAKNKMQYHEISLLLDNYSNIMIRSGRHCVHSWFNANKIDGSARASFYLYNTVEEVNIFVEKLKEILKMKSK